MTAPAEPPARPAGDTAGLALLPCPRPAQRNGGTPLAQAALRLIADEVHPIVPCVGGGLDMPLVSAAVIVGLRPVFPRSELGAGFMANGIAWESGLPTLCFVITSAGVYGLTQALYAAFVNGRPVVVISGDVVSVGGGCAQAGDGWDGPSVVAVTRNLTEWSVDAATPLLAKKALRRAVAIARQSRKPVHVNVPLSVQQELVT